MNGNDTRFEEEHDDDDDGTDCSPTDEVLPFAVLEVEGGSGTLFASCDDNDKMKISPSSRQPASIDTSYLTPYKSYYESIQLSTASNSSNVPPPGLMSSIISQDDSVLSTSPSVLDDSLHQQQSTVLASSTTTALVGESSHLPHSRVWSAGESYQDSTTLFTQQQQQYQQKQQGLSDGSIGFSLLMRKADDTTSATGRSSVNSSQFRGSHHHHHTQGTAAAAASRMPRLAEEEPELSSSSTTLPRTHTRYKPPSLPHPTTTTTLSSPSSLSPPPPSSTFYPSVQPTQQWLQSLFSRRSSTAATSSSQQYFSIPLTDNSDNVVSTTSNGLSMIVPPAPSPSRMGDTEELHRSQLRHQQQQNRRVESILLDETSYQVSMNVRNSTVREVITVMANPDFLPLWCEPLHKGMIIITKSSSNSGEGGASISNRNSSSNVSTSPHEGERQQREYDGEWIEATTSDLVSPLSTMSLDTMRSFWNCLGFPSYAKITMFVERLRGQIGLTIGPFPGGITCSHTFTVRQPEPPPPQHDNDDDQQQYHHDMNVVTVVDTVRISVDQQHDDNNNNNTSSTMGDLWSFLSCGTYCSMAVKKCFLPTVKGYMEQTTTSLSRLRVLVEHGETGYCIIEAADGGGDDDNNGYYNYPNNSPSTRPLLS